MIVDGRKIAEEIYTKTKNRVANLRRAPKLAIITCAPNFETKRYLELKEKKATAVGIALEIIELSETSTTEDFLQSINRAVANSDGIIVQLPVPKEIAIDSVMQAIPTSHDVDALNPKTTERLSPVMGSILEILSTYTINPKDTNVTIIGSGRLVGLPASQWFMTQGANVSVVTRDTADIETYTKNADIIVCGAGVPGLLKPSMIKEGVVILDAGTSEEGGELKGDADPACALKSSVFTPVPGGIGPITVAILLSNVVDCAEKKGNVL